MVKKPEMPPENDGSDSKNSLIRAAITVFAKKGYDGATVKDIADAANTNVSMISYYFDGKEGIYRACLLKFGRDRLAVAERVLKPAESMEEFRVRLQMVAEEFLITHSADPELTQIIHRECTMEHEGARKLFAEVFIKCFETFVQFLKVAERNGVSRSDIDPHIATVSFFGSLIHFSRTDQVQKEMFGRTIEDPKYREKIAAQSVRIFCEGILSKSASGAPASRKSPS